MAKYRVIRDNVARNGRYYREGDIVTLDPSFASRHFELVPDHTVKAEVTKEDEAKALSSLMTAVKPTQTASDVLGKIKPAADAEETEVQERKKPGRKPKVE